MADSIVWGVSVEDIQKGKIVDKPVWLPVEVFAFDIELNKKKDAMNLHAQVRVIGEGEYKGMENPFIYFSEKVPAMAIPFLLAIGFKQNPDGSFNQTLNADAIVGKKCKAHWVRGINEENNKPVNNIDDWAPLDQ